MNRNQITGLVLPAVLATALWGSAAPCVKTGYRLFAIAANDPFSQLVFAGCRFALAGLLTLLIAALLQRGPLRIHRGNIRAILAIGFFQCVLQYICYYIGLSQTTGTNAALLSGTQTFFSILLAHFLLKDDKINHRKALGCLAGFAGVLILNLGGLSAAVSPLGDGLILLSAVSAAMGALVSRVLARGHDPMILTGWQLTLGGLILLALGLLGGGAVTVWTLPGTLLLLYMAALSAAAFTLWTALLKRWAVSRVTIYGFLIPIFGTLFAALLLGEPLTLRTLAALALVSLGVILANRPQTT